MRIGSNEVTALCTIAHNHYTPAKARGKYHLLLNVIKLAVYATLKV